ncbi:MAG: MinD/ParA family protein [Peptococcaceae bacterium]
MTDQAASLRLLAQEKAVGKQELPRPETDNYGPTVVAVTSGKGGVGKTSLVVNMGLILAQRNQRTVIVDADLGLANVEVLLGIVPPYSVHDLLFDHKTIEDILTEGPFNLKIIAGGSGFQELANLEQSQRERLIGALSFFQDKSDFILIDTGAGISRNVLGFVAAAEEVVVIVTPEPTSLTDAYSLIKVLAKFEIHERVFLVVNQAVNEQEAFLTADKITFVANKFLQNIKINYLGFIGKESIVSEAVKNQNPFVLMYPFSQATKSVAQITTNFITLLGKNDHNLVLSKRGGIKVFVQKLVKLFR